MIFTRAYLRAYFLRNAGRLFGIGTAAYLFLFLIFQRLNNGLFSSVSSSSSLASSSSSVKEIDLALWRSAEAIANDQREFMNDGEWELLSIPSRYWRLRQDRADYAHVCFHVRQVGNGFYLEISSNAYQASEWWSDREV